MKYRDSATLKLASEINNFVRSKTRDSTVASVALEAARVTFSLVGLDHESSQPSNLGRPQNSDRVNDDAND
jgi:hypothetical protein